MSEAYRIKKFHHITEAKHKRLREENLVPLLARLSSSHIVTDEIDDLLASEEAMSLHIDEFDSLEEHICTIQNLLEGDWLIDFNEYNQYLYLMKFKKYSYQAHKHLYIKHFGQVSHVFKVGIDELSDDVLTPLIKADHLQTLPLIVSNILDRYEVLALASETQAKERESRSKAPAITTIKRGRPSKNGEVKIIKPAYKNDQMLHYD
jgi:hypothetical protein